MKHTILVTIFLVFLQSIVLGQDHLWSSKEDIILEYENYPDTNFQYFVEDNTSEITVKIYGNDSLEIMHYIRPYSTGEIDSASICDSIVIVLLCESCVEYHIDQLAQSKYRKWIKLSDQTFVSSKWVSKFVPGDKSPVIYTVPMMKMIKGEDRTHILLYTEKLTKVTWKELKRSGV